MRLEAKEIKKDEWVIEIVERNKNRLVTTKKGDVLRFKTEEEAEGSFETVEVYESYRERFENRRKVYTGEELKKRAIEKLKNIE